MTRVVGLPRSFDTRAEADEIAGGVAPRACKVSAGKVRVVPGGGGRRP